VYGVWCMMYGVFERLRPAADGKIEDPVVMDSFQQTARAGEIYECRQLLSSDARARSYGSFNTFIIPPQI